MGATAEVACIADTGCTFIVGLEVGVSSKWDLPVIQMDEEGSRGREEGDAVRGDCEGPNSNSNML